MLWHVTINNIIRAYTIVIVFTPSHCVCPATRYAFAPIYFGLHKIHFISFHTTALVENFEIFSALFIIIT